MLSNRELYEVIGRMYMRIKEIESQNSEFRAELTEKTNYITYLESRFLSQENEESQPANTLMRDIAHGVQSEPYVFGPPIHKYEDSIGRPVRDVANYSKDFSFDEFPYPSQQTLSDHFGSLWENKENDFERFQGDEIKLPISSMPVRQSNADVIELDEEEIVGFPRPPELRRQTNG
jgi:hypothetical protein